MNELKKNSVAVAFGTMRERCFYRAKDIAEETGVSADSARYALKVLARGGYWK
ncbi:MAG: hypothetical protein KKH74_01890 [Gammaproteobacteria bacterium]|nr:hypothetical protein [Gammaproteobacteria bacterium]MBU1731005.1 hypothetical protein [Gammaproteobacteria bacterium]MBU1893665.1 hypothetical protein [Gammaproteobacteria bacterium]